MEVGHLHITKDVYGEEHHVAFEKAIVVAKLDGIHVQVTKVVQKPSTLSLHNLDGMWD